MLATALVGVMARVTPRLRLRMRDATVARRGSSTTRASGASDGKVQNDAISIIGMKENPWNVGTYHSKRATHKVNELGDIIGEDEDPANILSQPGWDDAGKLRFCVATVANELSLSEDEVSEKLAQLFQLAPGIERRVGDVKIADIVRMVASLPDVVQAFVKLREILPNADLGKIVEGRPSVLLEDLDAMAERIQDLRNDTPKLNWDAILTDYPVLFEIRNLAGSVRELADKFPSRDVTKMIGGQPTLLLSVQSGDDMITYDHGSLKQVKATIEGDRTHDGW